MLLRFIICDENYNERVRLSSMIKEYFSNKPLFTVEYLKISSRHELLARMRHAKEYDFLFIDASADLTGAIDTLLKLRKCGFVGRSMFLIKHSDRIMTRICRVYPAFWQSRYVLTGWFVCLTG